MKAYANETELGPCPLCGEIAISYGLEITSKYSACQTHGCPMPDMPVATFRAISALAADARLGRLVREMRPARELIRARENKWAVTHYDERVWGDTPEAALEAAGVKEGEG